MPNTYVALATQTLATATATVTFSSISASYTDLVLVANAKTNASGSDSYFGFAFNGDNTSGLYSSTRLYGDGSTASSNRYTGSNYMGLWSISGNPASFGTVKIDIQNYSNSTTFKTVLCRTDNAAGVTQANVGLWRNTNAITSITLYPEPVSGPGQNFVAGSTFSLYGIANADQGAAKATGGIITEDSQYWYHTFAATGAFIPKQSLTCDVLVVAGGGGGGGAQNNDSGGGGGAGGLLGFVSQSLTATSYTVTVGAGGPGVNIANGTNGNDSQFGALTLVKGGGGGAYRGNAITTGGSGGGSGTSTGGAATSGQGNAGGNGNSGNLAAGGGGGAGAVGANFVSASVGGAGGVGSSAYSSWGITAGVGENVSGTVYFAGGGGGANTSTAGPAGGLGGGGAGRGGTTTGAGVVGLTNTGGGGGGGYGIASQQTAGAAGGSGVVIVRYAK